MGSPLSFRNESDLRAASRMLSRARRARRLTDSPPAAPNVSTLPVPDSQATRTSACFPSTASARSSRSAFVG
jgi:hypothetical protein